MPVAAELRLLPLLLELLLPQLLVLLDLAQQPVLAPLLVEAPRAVEEVPLQRHRSR
jgi:hypothetical protein